MTVVSPCAGRLAEWLVQVNESYPVGTVLGHIEAEQAAAPPQAPAQPAPPSTQPPPPPVPPPAATTPPVPPPPPKVEPRIKGLPVPADRIGATYISPRLKARIQELGLQAADLAGIAGTGAGGRVTIEDFERYIAHLEQQKLTPASPMRVAVADAMRRSWTRPLATVGLPVILDPLLAHRKQFDPRPGPTLYALRALALALAENSAPAGRLIGARIVHPPAVDIGFAVEAEEGVLVPVIRSADKKPLAELAPLYDRLLRQARARNLPADATGGSICTVTNYGTFGLIWATPIPLPEQTLVLGLGAGRKVPRWDEARGQFVPVMEAYLTLSFDHRVLDGGAAGRLLTRIAALMNQPQTL
jgi:pyruvate/2-oxoglutarate dehydrogenase complex dihydrolipoamide acyltransferase (E2) component